MLMPLTSAATSLNTILEYQSHIAPTHKSLLPVVPTVSKTYLYVNIDLFKVLLLWYGYNSVLWTYFKYKVFNKVTTKKNQEDDGSIILKLVLDT